VITIITNIRNGAVSKVKSVAEDDELMFTSSDGIIIRIPAKEISVQGRNTQGVRVMNMKSGDKVVGVARIKSGEAEKELKLTALKAREGEEAEEGIEIPGDEAEELEEIQDIGDLEDFENSEGAEEIEEDEDEVEDKVEEDDES
jgi:DNA gyrase subunit A